MTHELTSETLGLYALDALDGAERAAVEQHVQECAACREALAAEYRVLDALARATPQVRPRADLRDRVLGATRPPAAVTPRQGAYTSRAAWFGLAAAATLALVTSVAYVNAQRDLTALRSTLAEWQVRVANAEAQALRAAGAIETQHRMVRVLTSTDLVETALTGLPPASGARARAFVSPSDGTIVFTAHGLPPIPADRVYQLWAVVGNAAISGGIFTADASGRGQLVTELAPMDGVPAAIAVTLEPAGGVPQPTGPKYLLGTPGN